MTPAELDALDVRAARAMGYMPSDYMDRGLWLLPDGRIVAFHPTRSWADCGLLLDALMFDGFGVSRIGNEWRGSVRALECAYSGWAKAPLAAICLAGCEALEKGKGK